MKITRLGHAAVWIEAEKKLLIDPFLSGNPQATVAADELSPDFILLSHGHSDHLGDAIPIARRCGATIIAPTELADHCSRHGVQAVAGYQGGCFELAPGLAVTMTTAQHGSGVFEDGSSQYLGVAVGFLIRSADKTVYFAGDTGLFYDMKAVIGDLHHIDVALLPIGGVFTMGPADAVVAAGWLAAQTVIPIHYDTFPPIRQDVAAFKQTLEQTLPGQTVTILPPGGSLEL